MSEDNEPKTTNEENSDAAAKDAAKDLAKNATSFWKALDQKHQIYLGALAVTLLCSLLFGAFTVKFSGDSGLGSLAESMLNSAGGNRTSPALLSLGSSNGAFGGKLAFLGSLAGIGILIWSVAAKRKDAWVPLAVAGSAGIAVLGILMTRMGMGGTGNDMIKISVDGTLLGWWLPLAGAITATVISVQRILKA